MSAVIRQRRFCGILFQMEVYPTSFCRIFKAEVLFELHIFPNGNHGLGLGTKETDTKDGKHFEPEVCSDRTF